ncbi:MAG TPA: hypothetical protein VJ692_11585 [Nitrospiraceae bacterium]|nr:hypothetical protein [Nitrospiraceae bacterium]
MKKRSVYVGLAAFFPLLVITMPGLAQEEKVSILPIWPLNFDVVISDQTFAPKERAIELQAGFTALWYRNLEVRAQYRFFDLRDEEFDTTQHFLFLNPRWNNFIDLLDFPAKRPINRIIRHALFGPLEDQVVPYVGGLIGMALPGPGRDHPGRFYGGQIGTRVLLTRGVSLDVSATYTRFAIEFQDEARDSQRWLLTVGIRF